MTIPSSWPRCLGGSTWLLTRRPGADVLPRSLLRERCPLPHKDGLGPPEDLELVQTFQRLHQKVSVWSPRPLVQDEEAWPRLELFGVAVPVVGRSLDPAALAENQPYALAA